MENKFYQFHWLRSKLLEELSDLIVKFIISFLIVGVIFLTTKITLFGGLLYRTHWSTLLAISVASIAVILMIITTAIQYRRTFLLRKATQNTISRNEGAYTLEKPVSSPLTIYVENSSSFNNEQISKEISDISPSINLLGIKKIKKITVNHKPKQDPSFEIKKSDIFMLILDKEISPENQAKYRYATRLNKTTFVFLAKDHWDVEGLSDSFVNDPPTKFAFFSSINDLSKELLVFLRDTLISGYRKSRLITDESPKVVSRLAYDEIESSLLR